jgi:predicted Zn-ribbon and HTH transcriptional regulator
MVSDMESSRSLVFAPAKDTALRARDVELSAWRPALPWAGVKSRRPALPRARQATIRESLHALLRAGPATARDLSRQAGIPEREVAAHLEHLERSLRRRGENLVVETSECLDCGFRFGPRPRHRYSRPGSCPECRGRRISLPRFSVEVED